MWVGLLTDRINSKLEKSNLINQHALNCKPVPLSPPPPLITPPPFSGKKVNKPPSLLSLLPLPLPVIILHFTLLIYRDCKTWCGLIQDGLLNNWRGCVTSKFSYMYLWFSTLYSSSVGRTETVVFGKKKIRPPPQTCPRGYLALPPLTPSNVIEINKSLARGGGGLIEDFGTWLNTYVRSKLNNKVLVKYWIFFRCLDTLE